MRAALRFAALATVLFALQTARPIEQAFAQTASAQACVQTGAQSTFTDTPLALQTASFTATYDATPATSPMDGSVGFSGGAVTDYTGLAAITRFNTSGFLDVRNGANYAADVSVPYQGGASYHFRLVIDPANQTYSVFVTPAGQGEIALASNYAFRAEQATLANIGNWATVADAGSLNVCNMTVTPARSSGTSSSAVAPAITTQPAGQTIIQGQTATFTVAATGTAPLTYQWSENGTAIAGATSSSYTTPATTAADSGAKFTVVVTNSAGTATSVSAVLTFSASCQQNNGTNWSNFGLATQTAAFTATFDATPSQVNMDDTIGFSLNPATDYSSLAAIVRFNPSGFLDVRNGANYTADQQIPYVAGTSYHFRMQIDPTTQYYNVYVTPAGGSEVALASEYAFRTEQATLSTINNWSMDAAVGSASVCNMALAPLPGGVPAPASTVTLSLNPPSLDLGSILLGALGSGQVTVTNTGNGTATISGVTSSVAGISLGGLSAGQTIAAGQSATLTIGLAPALVGTLTGNITITSNATNSPVTIAVNALGTPLPVSQITTNPSSLSLGSVNVGASTSAQITVTNSGTADASISNISVAGAGINVSGLSTGQTIAAGQSATLTVSFDPSAAGSVSGSVTIASTAANSPTTVALSGTGVQVVVNHVATLTWGAGDSTIVSYNVYRGTVAGGPYTNIGSVAAPTTTYTDTNVQSATTYYYVVTSVNADGTESAYSNMATAVIP